VWVLACVDHYTAEVWAHVAKVGDCFAALQPVYDAVIDRWGRLEADIARGLELRHDWGPQYRSAHFTGRSAGWASLMTRRSWASRRPMAVPSGGIRTLQEQCLWAQLHDSVEELRQAVAGFVKTYNTQWLIGRLGHRTPRRPTRRRNQLQQHDHRPRICPRDRVLFRGPVVGKRRPFNCTRPELMGNPASPSGPQARALAFSRSNSDWSIAPASSSSLARAICSVGVASPVVATLRT
jgi:hypothetical protein